MKINKIHLYRFHKDDYEKLQSIAPVDFNKEFSNLNHLSFYLNDLYHGKCLDNDNANPLTVEVYDNTQSICVLELAHNYIRIAFTLI